MVIDEIVEITENLPQTPPSHVCEGIIPNPACMRDSPWQSKINIPHTHEP